MTIDEKTFHAAVADFATAGLQRSDQPVMQLELEAMRTERGRLSFALAVLSEARDRMVCVTHTIRTLGDVEPLEPQMLRPVHNLVGRHSDHLMAALRLLLLFERPDAPEPAVLVKVGSGAWQGRTDDADRRERLCNRLADRNAPAWVQEAAGMVMRASCCAPDHVADFVLRWTDADLVRAREWAEAQENAGADPLLRAPKHVQQMLDADKPAAKVVPPPALCKLAMVVRQAAQELDDEHDRDSETAARLRHRMEAAEQEGKRRAALMREMAEKLRDVVECANQGALDNAGFTLADCRAEGRRCACIICDVRKFLAQLPA